MLAIGAAGWGLRASLRRSLRCCGLALVLTALLVACGEADGSTSPANASGGSIDLTDPSGDAAFGTAPPEARGLEQVGGLDLEVASYEVPDVLDAEGGDELSAMLEALGLQPENVSLVIAVDPAGSLAIGRWELPGSNAGAILSAWDEAAGGDWQSQTLAGEPALSGRGVDGDHAWATARDGVFLYIVTDDRALAEAAALAGT